MQTKAHQARGVQSWAKELILQYLCSLARQSSPPVDHTDSLSDIGRNHKKEVALCELFCEDLGDSFDVGPEVGKYQRAGVTLLVCVDPNVSRLQRFAEAVRKKGSPFTQTAFICADPCSIVSSSGNGGLLGMIRNQLLSTARAGTSSTTSTALISSLLFDIVICHHPVRAFASETTARPLIQNASSLLNPAGFFWGTIPDSSYIWTRTDLDADDALVAEEDGFTPWKERKAPLYTLSWRHHHDGSRHESSHNDPSFGQVQYKLHIANESHPMEGHLIHFPTFRNLMDEYGMSVLEFLNLEEFYECWRHTEAARNLLRGYRVITDKIRILEPAQVDALRLMAIFVCRKRTSYEEQCIVDPDEMMAKDEYEPRPKDQIIEYEWSSTRRKRERSSAASRAPAPVTPTIVT